MKKLLILIVALCIHVISHAQQIYTIKADSVKITNDCDTAELIIENHTQNVSGFLFNKGKGRTEFRKPLLKISDSIYLIGADSLKLSSFWRQGGNTFDTSGILGIIDSNDLRIITRNQERIRVTANGLVGIGTTTPTAPLTVAGNINQTSGTSLFGNGIFLDNFVSYSRIFSGGPILYQSNNTGNQHLFANSIGEDFTGNLVTLDPGGYPNLEDSQLSLNVYGKNGALGLSVNMTGAVGINTLTPTAGYRLDVNGPTRVGSYLDVSAGDAYNIRTNPGYGNGWASGVDASLISFGSLLGVIGVNKQTLGDIPQHSLILGATSPGTITTIADFNKNPTFVVDGSGQVTINGGYSGIAIGNGATTNANAYNFNMYGGRGTGSGTTGDIIFSTGNAQASGTGIHTMTGRWWIKGNTGNLSNTSNPSSSIDVTGANGYSQLRLRTSYTPSSSADTNGQVGDVSWDDNYMYIKTSAGWKRTALNTF